MNTFWRAHRYRIVVGAPILFALLLNAGPVGLTSNSIVITPEASVAVEGGELFPILINVSAHTPINAAGALIAYPVDQMEVASIDTENSLIGLWSEQPSYVNELGTLSLSGGIVSSNGWSGDGQLVRVLMRAKKNGRARIVVNKGLLLAADGKGTDVLSERKNLVIYVRSPGSPSPDVNGDGVVNLADTNQVYLATFREYDAKFDFNEDGFVKWNDVLKHFYLQAE